MLLVMFVDMESTTVDCIAIMEKLEIIRTRNAVLTFNVARILHVNI